MGDTEEELANLRKKILKKRHKGQNRFNENIIKDFEE